MPERAWILLPSGKQPGLLVPRASTNDDLAIGLSRTYRWAGYRLGTSCLRLPATLAVPALRRSRFGERHLPSQRRGASSCTTRPRR